MRHARSSEWLRLTAFVALGSFVLHQARYAIGYGGHAGEALARDGHTHTGLALALSALIALGLPALTLLLATSSRPRRGAMGGTRIGVLSCAAVLLAAFWAQELLEGALSASHPGGLDAVAGHGGLIAIPLAGLLGCLVAFLQAVLSVAEDRVARGVAHRRLAESSRSDFGYVEPETTPRVGLGLVFGFACRPPPSLTTSS
jgi:hypothetical protein